MSDNAPPESDSSHRPIEHIVRDLKKVDEDIARACKNREKFIAELDAVAETAKNHSEKAKATEPTACSV